MVSMHNVHNLRRTFLFALSTMIQGRSQELEMGGAKLLGEGSGGRLRPPVGPGQSLVRGARGAKPPGSSRVHK